jgi:hypothetical protein
MGNFVEINPFVVLFFLFHSPNFTRKYVILHLYYKSVSSIKVTVSEIEVTIY